MNPKKPSGDRVVNAGIGLPPALIKKLDDAKGDHSRSKFASIIIRAYFAAIDSRKKKKAKQEPPRQYASLKNHL